MDSIPLDLLIAVVGKLASRDAAAFACASRGARAAHRASRAFRTVRVSRDGEVCEPASGAFDVTVAPGEPLADAMARCPPGGCVLLLPGTHGTPDIECASNNDCHVFGKGEATVDAPVEVRGRTSFAGITFRRRVCIHTEARAQRCVFNHLVQWCDGSNPAFDRCSFHANVFCSGAGTTGRFTRNDVHHAELCVTGGGAPRDITQRVFLRWRLCCLR